MTVTEQDITDYVDRVRAALADLPPAVRDELTEDLPEHLTEVAAEADGTLVDRLGEPEAYAAELRVAAGATGPRAGVRRGDRMAAAAGRLRARLARLDVRIGPLLGYATAGEFLRLLRPAWWVLRGYLAAALIGVLLSGQLALLPRPFGSALGGLLLIVIAVPLSVSLGRRAGELRRWPRRLMQVGAVVLACFGLLMVAVTDQQQGPDGPVSYYPVENPYDTVQDVYVYDGEGKLVPNARLFDQDGSPIRLGYPDCAEPGQEDEAVRGGYPYCPERAPFGPRPVPSLTPPDAGPAPAPTTAPGGAPPASPAPATSSAPAPTAVPPATTGPAVGPTR
ncbi:HAAS signaling domain-containing protein [Micromonospora siamensis]|uniref:Uncharacterized membrane protein n=1 Tax=Micromonospora siamensis TaxID=299152 RepID=A0A1C5HDM3_9ACTN|nr:hypothetical protein [Micromonospora siamensis]SCG44106.1 Uncharacterized membrane protein [Micromonospora siamensis]